MIPSITHTCTQAIIAYAWIARNLVNFNKNSAVYWNTANTHTHEKPQIILRCTIGRPCFNQLKSEVNHYSNANVTSSFYGVYKIHISASLTLANHIVSTRLITFTLIDHWAQTDALVDWGHWIIWIMKFNRCAYFTFWNLQSHQPQHQLKSTNNRLHCFHKKPDKMRNIFHLEMFIICNAKAQL